MSIELSLIAVKFCAFDSIISTLLFLRRVLANTNSSGHMSIPFKFKFLLRSNKIFNNGPDPQARSNTLKLALSGTTSLSHS